MFDYFYGILTDKRKTSKGLFITVEVANIGYQLEVTERDFNQTISDEKIRYYVSLIHREDSMSLYGFLNKETRDIFQILLSVSGVGAKMALALLNEFDACDLISFVIEGNFKELTRAKGVGPKLAQKIILELKDKLINWQKNTPISCEIATTKQIPQDNIFETQNVLLSLGYSIDEAKKSIEYASAKCEKQNNSEELLRIALEFLAKI